MASRVNININADDHSRAGLAALRANMQRLRRDIQRAGGDVRFTVRIDDNATRAQIRRTTRALRDEDVVIRTRLDPPTPPARTMRQRIQRGLGRAITLPVRLTSRGLLASVRGPVRVLGNFVSGVMSDGLGQGIIGAFKAAGPVGVAVLAAIIAATAGVIGAVLAAALTLGFGGAFVALATYLAFQNQGANQVSKKWSEVQKSIKAAWEGAADAMVPTILKAEGLLESLAKSFAPHFKQAMEQAAPSLNSFLDSVAEGIKEFGKRAFEPMMVGFDNFLLAFGPEFKDFMKSLGDSFGDLGNTVREHSGEIAMALRFVLELITLLVETINALAVAWSYMLRAATAGWGVLLWTVATFVKGFFSAAGGILQAADFAFGWLPGIGDKIKNANRAFQSMGDEVVYELARMSRDAINWGSDMDKANRKRQLQVDIAGFKSKLKQAREDLQKTSNKKAQARLKADISQLTAQIQKARNQLDALNGKTVSTYVTTIVTQGSGSLHDALAHGGVRGLSAAATGGVRSNTTLVGEQGPELINLAPGSRVRSNSDTRRLMGGGGNSGGGTIVIDAAEDDVSKLLLTILRKSIRVQGGNVQLVLGKGK